MKVRNIAGDETILLIEESENKAVPEKEVKKKQKEITNKFASTLPKPHGPSPFSKLWQRACEP